MRILLCSALCSKATIASLKKKTGVDISSSTLQKYYRMIAYGFVKNQAEVTTASTIPVLSCPNKWLSEKSNREECIVFHYASILNVPVLRQMSIFVSTLLHGVRWCRDSKGEQRFVVADVLNISTSMSALLLRLFGVHVMGLMTDMPGLMVGDQGRLSNLIRKFNLWTLERFDSYIFLTEAMNEVVNRKNKPYMIMEGLVDSDMKGAERCVDKDVRKIVYAGGLHERYGLRMLVEGFMNVEGDDLRLDIYGRGPFADKLPEYESKDGRVRYHGLKPNAEIVREELSATLLVNPRPTHEEFVKYSFPSKNMEYMASGTPLLTAKLPGMPVEYHQYVYLIEEETTEGVDAASQHLLEDLDSDALNAKGASAKQFVLKSKNNVCQTQRVLDFYQSICK